MIILNGEIEKKQGGGESNYTQGSKNTKIIAGTNEAFNTKEASMKRDCYPTGGANVKMQAPWGFLESHFLRPGLVPDTSH